MGKKLDGITSSQIRSYEGLVGKTAQMYAGMTGMEYEDLRQELSLKVAEALYAYSAKRSKLDVKNFVFGCLTNRVTDLRKSHCRRLSHKVTIDHIEDYAEGAQHVDTDRLQFKYFHVDRDQVFGMVEEGKFVLPATLTPTERSVLLLLTLDMSRTEIALKLSITRAEAFAAVESLQAKFRDWKPGSRTNDSSVVNLSDIAVAA